MGIREMRQEECLRVLARTRLARLACAHENQPYIVPVYLTYEELSGCLYGFTTPGQKVEWMRANPLVCVEVDEITADNQWVSVIVFGRYEELAETPESDGARFRGQERPRQAWQILKTHPVWWEPGCSVCAARADRDPAEAYIPVYYRVRIDRVTGHEATRDTRDAISYAASAPPAGKVGWLHRALAFLPGTWRTGELAFSAS